MTIIPWPNTPPTWLQTWAIWRFQNSPAPRPAGIPKDVKAALPCAYKVLEWLEWRRKGKPPPRPDGLPLEIPKWGFDLLKMVNIAVPLIPPPPPPPPPPTYADSWTLPSPLVFTAWAWTADGRFRDTPNAMCQKMAQAGVKTVGIQIGQYPDWVPDKLHEFGLKVFAWGAPSVGDHMAAVSQPNIDGYMTQVEGYYEYLDSVQRLIEGVGAGKSIACVTTDAGFQNYVTRPDGSLSTVEMEKMISLGCTRFWIECYAQGPDPSYPPKANSVRDAMWQAKQIGAPYRNPVAGLYWNVPLSFYVAELAAYGKQVGGYLAETMSDSDWAAFATLGT